MPKGCQKDAKGAKRVPKGCQGSQGSKRVPKKKKESDLDLLECIHIEPWALERPGGRVRFCAPPLYIFWLL